LGKPNKFRRTVAVVERVANAKSISQAARDLDVNRSTLHRWIASEKIPHPGVRRRVKDGVIATNNLPLSGDWAASVRQRYDLSASESKLVDLGTAALAIAEDKEQRPEIQLAAMARFAALLKQLNLEAETDIDGQIETYTKHRSWSRGSR
jgi:transposase-like protein